MQRHGKRAIGAVPARDIVASEDQRRGSQFDAVNRGRREPLAHRQRVDNADLVGAAATRVLDRECVGHLRAARQRTGRDGGLGQREVRRGIVHRRHVACRVGRSERVDTGQLPHVGHNDAVLDGRDVVDLDVEGGLPPTGGRDVA